MPSKIKQQLKDRETSKNKVIYNREVDSNTILLTSPSDIGVIRNGGRQGSSHGPDVILNELGKLQKSSHEEDSLHIRQVTTLEKELSDFEGSQTLQAENIEKQIKHFDGVNIVHIGGGHDHVYPFLTAIEKKHPNEKMNILNIDAHLDTRVDQSPHSGTPFRQFSNSTKVDFKLHQIGIQREANPPENFKKLRTGKMLIHYANDIDSNIESEGENYLVDVAKKILDKNENSIHVLSVDLDCVDSRDFRSCSASNPSGFSWSSIRKLVRFMMTRNENKFYLGIYEYNPLFDDISNNDGKKIAWEINQLLKKSPMN